MPCEYEMNKHGPTYEDRLLPLPETRIIVDDEYHMQNIASVWAPTGPNRVALGIEGQRDFLPWVLGQSLVPNVALRASFEERMSISHDC